MQTHDEETRRFFKHSSVQVLLCPRSAGKRHSWAKQKVGHDIFFFFFIFVFISFIFFHDMTNARDSSFDFNFFYFLNSQEVGTIYTHHQKTVIVDADAGNNRRKIIAFVGGLDICDGRYDTPHHPLFRTLQTVHKDDYHNPTYTVIIKPLFFFVVAHCD